MSGGERSALTPTEPGSVARRAGFVPWPFPVAAGLGAGVSLASVLGRPAAVASAVALIVAGSYMAVARRGAGAPGRPQGPWRRPPVRPQVGRAALAALSALPASVWPLALLAAGCGVLRYQLHDAGSRWHATLVAPWLGVTTTWEGHHDGVTFRADRPVRVGLAPVSRTALPVGRLVLTGTAQTAPGTRNPGGFDYGAYLARRGMVGQLFVDELVTATPLTTVRERLRRGVAAGLPPDLAALMTAMTLGLRDDLGPLRDSFAAAGLAHLLSLSGLHFGVLLAAAARAMTRLGQARVYALMLLTVAFVVLVGTAPSVLRAAAMALAALIGFASGVGRFEPWTVLTLAFGFGLLVTPQMLFDIAFQLSYLALAGLLLFTGPLAARLGLGFAAPAHAAGRVRAWLRATVLGGCVVSLAAQVPSLSLVAGSFGTVPLVGPLVNVVAVPLAAAAVPLGFAAGLVGLVAEPLAWLVNRVTLLAARPLTWLADVGAAAPALAWGEVGWLGHVCWALFVAAAALWVRGRLRTRAVLLVVLATGGISHAAGPRHAPPDVWFLDVGQGDSILVRLPGRYEVLIDGGGSPFSDDDVGRRVVIPALRALGVDELEVVVATHADADHVEGLFSVLEEVAVGTLVTGPAWPGVALDERLREVAAARRVEVHVARRGETLVLGGTRQAATLEVLHPPADTSGLSSNEASVVLLLRHGGHAVALFTGDAGTPTEERIAVPHVQVLQAGHHGSRFSTGEHVLRAASPRVAVVSVGDNNYGHPHPDVLARLAAHGVEVFVTRSHGAVRVDLGNRGAVSTMVVDDAARTSRTAGGRE